MALEELDLTGSRGLSMQDVALVLFECSNLAKFTMRNPKVTFK